MKAALVAMLIFTSAPALAAEPITGRASVIDGDTVEIRGTRIRLWGIDAPESRQTCQTAARKPYRCGAAAAEALDDLLAKARPAVCAQRDVDRYGRVVARCTAGGRDVAEDLVRRGLAFDYPKFSKGAYAAAEAAAKSDRAGAWAGSFVPPWEWRRQR